MINRLYFREEVQDSILPSAKTEQLQEYYRTGWANNSVLYSGRNQYPHINDTLNPLPNSLKSEINDLELASLLFHGDYQGRGRVSIRNLSWQIDQFLERNDKIPQDWEFKCITDMVESVNGQNQLSFQAPGKSWKRLDYQELYNNVRVELSKELFAKVAYSAGVIATVNEVNQLFVRYPEEKTPDPSDPHGAIAKGSMGRVVGLSVSLEENDSRYEQIHDVDPIVVQEDGSMSVITALEVASFYALYKDRF